MVLILADWSLLLLFFVLVWVRNNQNKRTKYRACKTFAEEGSCRYGETCKYAHVAGAKAGQDVSEQLAALEKEKTAATAAAAAAAAPTKPAEQ